MLEKLKSRKFWIALLGALAPLAGDALGNLSGVDPTTVIIAASSVVVSYIFGQSYVDQAGIMSKKAHDLIESVKADAKK
tara:strand:+ start:741 stop:977 length:237 start_codon:yes stop_codon:yes gene_type:complete